MPKMKKAKYAKEDETLQALLNMDGLRHTGDDKFRIEINTHKVKPTPHRPYGVKYRLVLLDPNGTRIVCYDNAHGPKIKTKRKIYGARRITWDHKHSVEEISFYEFESASQLLTDFWKDVHQITTI